MRVKLLVHYTFERKEIENLCTTRFHQVFAEQMPSEMLKNFCGAARYRLSGDNYEAEEPYLIPRIRRFFSLLDQQTDGALAYFSELESDFIFMNAACQLSHLTVLEAKRWNRVCIRYQPPELEAFFRRSRGAIQRMGQRAGLPQAAILRRERCLQKYFDSKMHQTGNIT